MDKTLLASAICLAFSSHALAESYQFEGNARYSDTNYDYSYVNDTHLASVSGTYYFQPVKTDNHPLQEAAFLEKNSGLGFVYQASKYSYDFDYDGITYTTKSHTTYKNSTSVLAADGYLFDGLLYLGGLVAQEENRYTEKTTTAFKMPPKSNTETRKGKDSDNDWRINVGVSPVTGLLIWSEFEKDIDVNKSWNLNAKYVMEFSSSALNLQTGYGHNALTFFESAAIYPASIKLDFSGEEHEKVESAYVLGDFYFDKTLSLGLGVNHDNYSHDEAYILRGRKFFSDGISVQAEYINNTDMDSYSIGVSMRF